MPIYQYQCRECGEVSEFLQPNVSAVRDLACSACGSHNLKKLISTPILLKNRIDASGKTCCGREERCESPACSTGNQCRRH